MKFSISTTYELIWLLIRIKKYNMKWKKEVGDIEVYPTLFVYVGHDVVEGEYEYVLHSSYEENTIGEWCDRMRNGIKMIGFNSIGYDYPVMHHILTQQMRFETLSPSEVCLSIYNFSKSLIDSDKEDRQWINPKDFIVPQLDLFQIHHFANKSRRTSLKAIEVALRMDSIEDLPYPPDEHVTVDKVREIADYCHHDVRATKLFYEASKSEISMRIGLSKTYQLDLINASDAKLGSEIILKFIDQKMDIPKWEIKKLRTYRKGIDLREHILSCVSFKTEEFNNILDKFRNTVVNNTKGDIDFKQKFRDVTYEYGTGGLHACTDNGSYHETEDKMILDLDVKSYYPNLAIRNKKAPQHLGKAFYEVYEDLYDQRAQYAKGTPENYGIKISLNSVYG